MKAQTAQLAGGSGNADRVFVTENAVIVLDGATALEPVDVDPATYAHTLGTAIAEHLDQQSDQPLPDVVAHAITRAASQLRLIPGHSPSSTVTVLRTRDRDVDLYVLGDSPIHYGTESTTDSLTDGRLSAVAPVEHQRYVSRLRAGHGYDEAHRAALVSLQRVQRAARNTADGYWIAEADPHAAHHAVTRTLAPTEITWAVLATDGAAEWIDYCGPRWSEIAHYDAKQLTELLQRITEWERSSDRDGRALPRAKRHDDKTIAAVPAIC